MSTETLHCGRRTYVIECRITKNGHKYITVAEQSFGRLSKVMVFHDHFDEFFSTLERVSASEPLPASAEAAERAPAIA